MALTPDDLQADSQRQPYHDELLYRLLLQFFGNIDDGAIARLWPSLTWVEVVGGQTLIAQGEVGDALYLLVSGRLRVSVRGDNGEPSRTVGEIGRGEIVGEVSLLTDEPRMASVLAIRDSLLVRLGKPAFDTLMASDLTMSRALTRQVLRRLKATAAPATNPRPSTIALVAASAGVDLVRMATGLAAQLARYGRVEVVDAARVHQTLESPDATLGPRALTDIQRRFGLWLDQVESRAEFVLLLADPEPTAWTARCCRVADELLLLVDASQPPALHPIERLCLMNRSASTEAAEVLVLLHADTSASPRGTRAWLDRRPLADHLHLRPGLAGDLARLARYLNRSAIGLVMAGGGARGLAHLGVMRALQEQGVEIDCVGGTSIGAVMAAYVASDRPLDVVMANARRAFDTKPTGDFNPMPWLSVFRGARLRRILTGAVHDLLGFDADVEDLWKPCFSVATNYSQAREQVLCRGRLVKVLLASTSIPGALPPVLLDGDLLCDGGSFNNFPADVMRARRGVGHVIGIDLDARAPLRVDLEDVPGGWALFVDQWRSPRRRRYRLPSLPTYLMTVMVLNSLSRSRRARALTDLYFNPPLDRVGLLQWKRFDQIVQRGYEHGITVLNARADIELPAADPASAPLR